MKSRIVIQITFRGIPNIPIHPSPTFFISNFSPIRLPVAISSCIYYYYYKLVLIKNNPLNHVDIFNFPLKMNNYRLSILIALFILFAGFAGLLNGSESKKVRKPNIIIFSFDTLRADHLSCYGCDNKTSPAIDAFAKDAVLFTNTISQASFTAPSHMSLFTSLTPAVHKVNNPNDGDPDIFNCLNEGITTLPMILQQQGYRTIGMHGGGCVSSEFGFDRGFDSYTNDFFFNFHTPYFQPQRIMPTIQEHVRKSKETGQPLFLFLHHFLCHHPYIHAPESIQTSFLKKPVKGLPTSRDDLLKNKDPGWGVYDEDSFWRDIDLSNPEHKRHVIALYDGGILYADTIFQQLLDILKEEGCYRDSLIILTSDHGEEFNEHGGNMHGRLFIEQLHVPLIVKFPQDRYAETIIERPVRIIDIMPTVTDQLGITISQPIQGSSLLPLLSGEKGEPARTIASYALIYKGPDTAEQETAVRLVDNGYVYSNQAWNGQSEWLFDERADPAEQRNLVGGIPLLAKKMSEQATELLRENQAFSEKLSDKETEPGKMNDTLKKQLKALGYVQ